MRKNVGLVPSIIFLVSCCFIYTLERVYDHYHILDQINTLFDADPATYLDIFGNGWGGCRLNHPLAGALFNLPIRLIGKALSAVLGGEEILIRRSLALWIVPLFEGAKNLLLYLLMIRIGASVFQAVAMCGLNLLAFSTLTIGSQPESFALSSTAIALFVYWMVRDFSAGGKVSLFHWVIAGILATGITLTNLFPLLVFFLLGRKLGQKASLWQCVRQSALITVLSLTLAVALGSAACIAYSYSPKLLIPGNNTEDFGITRVGRKPSLELAMAAVNTIGGVVRPDITQNEYYVLHKDDKEVDHPTLSFMFTYRTVRFNSFVPVAWAMLFCALLLLGGLKAYYQSDVWKAMVIGSIALLVFNFSLHHFYYKWDTFLYSLHWQVPMLLLLAGLTRLWPGRVYSNLLLIAFAAICGITGFQFIFRVIAAAKGEMLVP